MRPAFVGWPRSGWEPCTWPPTPSRRSPRRAPRRRAPEAGCCARRARRGSTASGSRRPTPGWPSASGPRSTPPGSAPPVASRGPPPWSKAAMTDLHLPPPARVRAGILPVDEDELVACVSCGLCLPHCPTYRVSGLERLSPRGRIAAMRAVELEGAPFDDAFCDTIETCVQCLGCEAACPSTVPFGHLVEGANAALVERPATPSEVSRSSRRIVDWVAFTLVLPRHAVLLALTWALLVAQ